MIIKLKEFLLNFDTFYGLLQDEREITLPDLSNNQLQPYLKYEILKLANENSNFKIKDYRIVKDPIFKNIFYHNYSSDENVLSLYKKMVKDRKKLRQIIIYSLDSGNNEKKVQIKCRKLEKLYGRIWLIDVLNEFPEFLSDDENEFNKNDSLTVISYIGGDFIEHFWNKIDNYIESNYNRGMSYIPVIIDYIQIVCNYIPYIYSASIVYKKLKQIDLNKIDEIMENNDDYIHIILGEISKNELDIYNEKQINNTLNE
jgi:hypothetical protein